MKFLNECNASERACRSRNKTKVGEWKDLMVDGGFSSYLLMLQRYETVERTNSNCRVIMAFVSPLKPRLFASRAIRQCVWGNFGCLVGLPCLGGFVGSNDT